jgi:hypothetical protein
VYSAQHATSPASGPLTEHQKETLAGLNSSYVPSLYSTLDRTESRSGPPLTLDDDDQHNTTSAHSGHEDAPHATVAPSELLRSPFEPTRSAFSLHSPAAFSPVPPHLALSGSGAQSSTRHRSHTSATEHQHSQHLSVPHSPSQGGEQSHFFADARVLEKRQQTRPFNSPLHPMKKRKRHSLATPASPTRQHTSFSGQLR